MPDTRPIAIPFLNFCCACGQTPRTHTTKRRAQARLQASLLRAMRAICTENRHAVFIKSQDMRLTFDTPTQPPWAASFGSIESRFLLEPAFVYRGLLKSHTLSFSAPQDRTRTIRKRTPGRSSHFKLKIGSSAAHDGFCLMLLGSPPDMVHSPPLRSTGLSSLCGRPPCRKPVPPCPHHPRCSGLRVQSTANAPMCAALCGAEQKVFDC